MLPFSRSLLLAVVVYLLVHDKVQTGKCYISTNVFACLPSNVRVAALLAKWPPMIAQESTRMGSSGQSDNQRYGK